MLLVMTAVEVFFSVCSTRREPILTGSSNISLPEML